MNDRSSRHLESLETRRLFAVTLTDGHLNIFGSSAGDLLTVQIDPADPTKLKASDHFTVKSFAMSDVKDIYMEGREGDDALLIVEDNGPVTVPARLYGGDGNDTLLGGYGNRPPLRRVGRR
jgi:hypothetical protein